MKRKLLAVFATVIFGVGCFAFGFYVNNQLHVVVGNAIPTPVDCDRNPHWCGRVPNTPSPPQ